MTRNKPLVAGAIVIVVAAAAILAWQAGAYLKSSQDQLPKLTLALDWTPNTNHTGIYVAKAKGWYKQHGIELEILPYSGNVTATNLVSNKKADVGIGSMEDIVGENAKNHAVVSMAAITPHNMSGFIVRTDSGITSPKGLDGKVYGGYGTAMEEPVAKQVIQKAGGQGTFQNVTLTTEAMQALETKKIDFVWVFEGWEVIQAKLDGLKTTFFPITKYGIPDAGNLYIIATPQSINSNNDVLKRFMAATSQGYEYARSHPKEAAQMLIDANPKETFPDKQLVFESQKFLSAHYADANQPWGVQNLKSWTGYPKFMLQSGAVTDEQGKPVARLDYGKLFTNQFLNQ